MKLIFVILSLIITVILSTSIELSLLLQLGFFITFLYFFKLIDGLGSTLPIKEVMSLLLFIQFFVSPLITYRYFDNDAIFHMYVNEEVYFTYVIPAVLLFILGLNLPLRNERRLYFNAIYKIKLQFGSKSAGKSINLILIGFLFEVAMKIVNIPSLFFVFYLGSLLRFIGAFMLYFSSHPHRYFYIGFVFIQFTIEIISGGIFYDLFVWLFFLYMLMEFRWKSSFLRKLSFIIMGGGIVFFIQTFKSDYRKQIWSNSESVNQTEVFAELAAEKIGNSGLIEEKSNLDKFISRLNTGWIVSKVLQHTPRYQPFADGELIKNDLVNVLLPRFLFPDKAKSGGEENQKKFTRFTGRRLIGNTTMRIGAISDAYVNYGVIGGWVFIFILGLFFNLVIYFLLSASKNNPLYVLWVPFVFAYAVRMSDVYVILNYTFKAVIVMIIVNRVFFSRATYSETNEIADSI